MPGEEWHGLIADSADPRPVASSEELLRGWVWTVRRDLVDFGNGHIASRDVMVHPGAVAVLALDEHDRVLLIRQYRHPVGMYLFEVPAGLLDVDGEDPLLTAQRELQEEAGVRAGEWHLLLDTLNSPGGSSESLRIYLARGLDLVERSHTGEAEEASLPAAWVPLREAVSLVMSGSIHNLTTQGAILAAYAASLDGWAALRDPRTTWALREDLERTGRVRSTP